MKHFFIEIFEGIGIALGALRANLMRSILTTLGVIIGVTTVVLTGWSVDGLDSVFRKLIGQLGADVIYVDKWDWSGRTDWREARNRKDITLQQAEELISRLHYADAATPFVRDMAMLVRANDRELSSVMISATYAANASIALPSLRFGRFHSPVEDRFGYNVVTLGSSVSEELFGEENPVGRTVWLKGREFTVIGVLESRAMLGMDQMDNELYMPLKTFMGLFGAGNRSITVSIKAIDSESLEDLRLETIGQMRQIRNLPPTEQDDFSINEIKVFEDALQSINSLLFTVGICVTIISCIVGAIGIMNIMFVSVAERTREIGIRKAVGARRSSILFQFLVESSSLSVIGAFISFVIAEINVLIVVSLGQAEGSALEFFRDFPSALPLDFLIYATVAAILVGVLSGIMPAFRGAFLDPVDALRSE